MVNPECYAKVFTKFWELLRKSKGINCEEHGFQQVGTTSHILNLCLIWLREGFQKRQQEV